MSEAAAAVVLNVDGEWPILSIGELASADGGSIAIGPFGSSMKADTYTQTGIPVVRGNNLKGRPGFFGEFVYVSEETAARFARCLVSPGDLVFPHRGAVGEVGLVVDQGFERWMLSTSMMKLRPDPTRLDSSFAFYFFRSSLGRHQLLKNASQVGTPGIGQPLASLRACELALPPLNDQRAVASLLGALDDKIQQNRRTAQALERLARSIFRAWFVDFEPVKAKAAGATAFPSMPQSVFDALPTRFVESDIGPVPEGWKVGAIKCLATISKAQINPQDRPEEFVDHFSLPAYDAEMRPTVEAGTAIKSNKFLVVPGCVLFSKLNPRIARVWLPPLVAGRRQIASTEFLVFIPRQMSDRHYLYCQFQQTAFREKLTQDASGTSNSHQRVRPDDVLNRPVIVPTAPIRIVFAGIADPLFALMSENQDEAARLATMRDYLLPKLLSGDVHVETAYG